MTTSSAFGENVDRLGSIRSILDNYPFSAGLLREILQNSDDARATAQTFLLDCRRHPSDRICDQRIADTQGPALLAFNNARFLEEDWVALQNISKSSKREDTSKIGKFGIGIRSCYHVTDFLQILSGEDLVIFDPQSSFSRDGGARYPFNAQTIGPIRDHFQSFKHFLPPNWNGEVFDGTVVRLPLRTEPGELREKIVSPEEIKHLFQEFIGKELNIAMLFLHHLRSIDFIIIDETGIEKRMAHCIVETTGQLSEGVCKQVVHLQSEGSAKEEWLVTHQSFPNDEVLGLLSDRAHSLGQNVLKKHKLRADIGLAFPLSPTQSVQPDIGQLFTFLRLPIKTGFPAHIHSLFSLTPSRQNLRPHGENGIVRGSDDYILIEWNKLLFDIFIPRAWSQLLRTITLHFPRIDIFSAWPVAKHFTESDSAYWATFPQHVLNTVLENDVAVWPAICQGVKRLEDVFVASASISDEVVQALVDTGVSVCRPPDHLFAMIMALPRCDHRILTPERASVALRGFSNLGNAPAKRRAAILQYLLSSENIKNIIGLPVIPTVSGSFVSLAQPGVQTFTLLDTSDVELFRPCDGDAISLDELPPSVLHLFRQKAPQTLNVKWLDPDQVVAYLAHHPTRRGLQLSRTEADGAAIAFLSKFWVWLDRWGNRSSLLAKLGSELVLPCVGGLRPASRVHPVFDTTGIDPGLSACLSGFGVPFLSSALEPAARSILTRCGFLKEANEMHALLDAMVTVQGLVSDRNSQLLLFNHFNRYMVESTWYSFGNGQKSAFRKLPIFPIIEYDANVSERRRWAAVDGLTVYGVRSFELLPVLPNAVFVDVNVLDQRLLPLLNESKPRPLSDMEPRPLSDMEVLDMTVTRLDQQPKKLLAHMLRHIASHQSRIIPRLKKSLGSEKYAYSSLGIREVPQTLIDPSSPLYPLFVNDNRRLHSLRDEEERSIANSLSQLGLLDKSLSANNITDRIHHISSTASFNGAVRLLNIIDEHSFNCRHLFLDNSLRWLPTQKQTLVTAAECRPGREATSEELHLFDKVIELVHSSAMISPSLRNALGWNEPIPVDILLRQFRVVLDHPEGDVYDRVKNLIKELSRRQRSLTTDQRSSVRSLLEKKKWVPTSEYTLVETWQAVFSSSFQGIYTVAPDLSGEGSETRDFMIQLDCLSAPSFATVTRRLAQLKTEPPSAAVTASAIATLKFAVSMSLTESELSQLLVPDDLHILRPFQEVLFNDVGENSLLLSRNEVCLANSSIDDTLARALGLQRLGLKHAHLQTLGEDMGVTPATVVEKTLAQYTEKQFLPEFLANAHDAGASKLIIIINKYVSVEGNFLSPALETLHNAPSVMVYNDREFSESDFEGICRTHIGGKANNRDSIGQFGLGALTMFHITECAMIYSGDEVLFLDPSKSYLPIARRASLRMPLKYLDQVYPGHTRYLKGLSPELFDAEACRVKGTFFFLPLRSSSSIPEGRKPFVSSFYDTSTFQHNILDDFRDKAGECLLFIKVNDIEARERSSAEVSSSLWSLTTHREQAMFDGFIETRIEIDSYSPSSHKVSTEWFTMVALLQASDMPPELCVGAKSLRVGLAAPLSDNHRAQSKFFSMLPLAIPTTLPVHVNASFKMSSDRRQIRLDSYDNDDTRFNRWLLKMKVPPLYLALLERIAQERDNTRWWPGTRQDVYPSADEDEDHISTAQEDALTSILIESFYSEIHLPASSARSIFCSLYSAESFNRSDAILYSTLLPPPVPRVIDILKPRNITRPATPVRQYLKKLGLTIIDPSFVSQLLLTNGGAEKVREQLSDDELGCLLVWLSQGRDVHLHGLPLLYLQDKTWAKFETEGPIYYSFPSSSSIVKDNFLPAGRFIHQGPTMPARLLETLANSTIHVATLDAAGVRRLVEERLTSLDTESKAPWVDRFWRVYPKLPEDGLLEQIDHLPLVPTLPGTLFKSLTDCRESGLLTDKIDQINGPWLIECFQDLGLDVVSLDHFPSALRDVLRHKAYSSLDTQFHRFLHCISPIVESAVQSFRSWPLDRRTEFSEWVRDKIKTRVLDKHLHTLQQLPIWWARKGWELCLCPASEVSLLPLGISLDTGRFCRNFVTADAKASHLGLNRDTLTHLYQNLDLPHKLLEGDDETIYHKLLTPLLNLGTQQTIRVPNADRLMVDCNSLFERSRFFKAAFGELSDRFILQSFNSFTPHLYTRGLKRETDLNLDLFSDCARAFQNECGRAPQTESPLLQQERVQRAEIIFQTYCETLPLHVPPNQSGGWQSMDSIQFIPRSMLEERQYMSRGIQLPASIRNLPRFVSPRQIVLTKHHAIAWTQRAALGLQHQPLERLLLVYPDFGKPSVGEVVAHLAELHTLSLSHGSVVVRDLRMAYEWLDEQKISSLQSARVELQESPIFLNVDDPERGEPWVWCSARQMAFETRDVGKIKRVRQFLSPFTRLLKGAGVLEAFYPELEAGDDGAIPEEHNFLRQCREGFSELRAMNQLVDVTFIAEEEDSSQAITDACSPLLSAHRAYLSVCNAHFKDRFTGGYADSQAALAPGSNLLQLSLPASSFAIKTVLDYLYTGHALNREHPVELEDLLQTLELSGYLHIDALFHLAQREVVERRLVNPVNFSAVRDLATTISADGLKQWCDKYEAKNLEYIRITTEGDEDGEETAHRDGALN
ncbi:hypothetical protein MD484_g1553, partial [Candolleomyces efflorescens]